MILTSKRHAEHPFASQNTQQLRESFTRRNISNLIKTSKLKLQFKTTFKFQLTAMFDMT